MGFFRDLFGLPPAQPQTPAVKQEKAPADPKKEAMRELAGEIKNLEAKIGKYEDVDLNSTEAPSQETIQPEKAVGGKRLKKDMRKELKARPSREALQAALTEIDELEQQIKDFEPEAEVGKPKRRARGELKKNARAQKKQPLGENVIAKKDLATKEGWKNRAEIKKVLLEIEEQEKALRGFNLEK